MAKTNKSGDKCKKTGPKPEYLTLKGDWRDAVKKLFGKKKPAEERPDEENSD